jgi:hypothetical protein
MQKQVTAILLSTFLCSSCWGQQSNFLSTVSPKLRTFLRAHPPAAKTLTAELSSAFTNTTVRLFYYYPDKEFKANAFHFYPNMVGMADVHICVAEDQYPLDEFISILFETINTKGVTRFAKLDEDAISGNISRTEYAREKLKVEFEAEKNTRDLLVALKLSKKDIGGSVEYGLYVGCPDKFEDFLPYLRRVHRHGDVFYHEYELLYDSLRKPR